MRVSAVVLLLCAFLCLTIADDICTSGTCGAGANIGACTPNVAQATVDDFQPALDNAATFTGNTLNVNIFGPLVTGRVYTELRPTDMAFESTCSFGVGTFWSALSQAATCSDKFTFSLPWANHADCGFTKIDETDATAVYSTSLTMTYTDSFSLGGQPSTREHSVPFKLFIAFPKFVDIISSNITVSSIVTKDWALTTDSFDPATMRLSLAISTVVDWPNMLRGPFSISTPNGDITVADGAVLASAGCTADASSVCKQVITFSVEVTDGICSFDGTYTATGHLYTCRPGQGDEDCTNDVFTASISILSSDVCGSVSLAPQLTGNLYALSAEPTGIPSGNSQTSFNLGTSGWFYAAINSEGNDIDLEFDNIWFSDGGATTNLRVAGVNTADGTAASLAVNNANKFFSIYFTSLVFRVVPGSPAHNIIFHATCKVTFHGNTKRTVEFAFAADGTAVDTAAKFKLAAPQADNQAPAPAASNQVALIAGIVGGVAGVALLTVGVALIIRRYRTKAAAGLVNNSA